MGTCVKYCTGSMDALWCEGHLCKESLSTKTIFTKAREWEAF